MREQEGTCNLRYDVENYVRKIYIILAMAPEVYLAFIVQHKTEQSLKVRLHWRISRAILL
jgi:hypothetical protein